jgi:hypothetical protein
MGFLLIAYCMAPIQQTSLWTSHGTSWSWTQGEAVSVRIDEDGLIINYAGSWSFGMEDVRS